MSRETTNNNNNNNNSDHYDTTYSQTTVGDEEDIQTIQSGAMTTSASLHHGDDYSKERFLSLSSTLPLPLLLSSSPLLKTKLLTSSPEIPESSNSNQNNTSSLLLEDAPPSPTTTPSATRTNTIAVPQTATGISPPMNNSPCPPRTLVDTGQDMPTSGTAAPTSSPTPLFLSSSQSLLYHTLATTAPSPIMDNIVTKDHTSNCNNTSNRHHEDHYWNDVPRIHVVDDEEEGETLRIDEQELITANAPNVNDTDRESHNDQIANDGDDNGPAEFEFTMSYSTIMSSLSGNVYFDSMNYTDDDTGSKTSQHPYETVHTDKDGLVVEEGNRRPKIVYDLTKTTAAVASTIQPTGWTAAALLRATTWSTAYEDDDDEDHEPTVPSSQQDPTNTIHESDDDDNSYKKTVRNPACSGMAIYQMKQRLVCSSVILLLFVILIVGMTFGLNSGNGSTDGNAFNKRDKMTTNQTSDIVNDATNNLEEPDYEGNNNARAPHPAPVVSMITTNSPTRLTTDNIPMALPPTKTSFLPTSTTLPSLSTNTITSAPSFSEQNVDSVPSSDPAQSPPTTAATLRPQRQTPSTPMMSVAGPIPAPSSITRRPTEAGMAPAPVRRVRTPVRAPAPIVVRTPSVRPQPPTRSVSMPTSSSLVRRPTVAGMAPAPVRRVRTPVRAPAPIVVRTPSVRPRPPTRTGQTPIRVPTTTTAGRAPVRMVAPTTTSNTPPPKRMRTLTPTTVVDPTLEPSELLLTTRLPTPNKPPPMKMTTLTPTTVVNLTLEPFESFLTSPLPTTSSVTITDPPSMLSTNVNIVTATPPARRI